MEKSRKKFVPYLLILSLVLISGCISIPDVFGRDVISIQQSVIENGVRDVIVVKSIETIPKSPLLPDQQMVMSFILENRDNLKSSRAYVDLFNAPTMRDLFDRPCNFYAVPQSSLGTTVAPGVCPSGEECYNAPQYCPGAGSYTPCDNGFGTCCQPVSVVKPEQQRYCSPDQCGLDGCTILPGEEKPINFVMKTPTEDDIKNIKTQTKLNFKTTYDFDGSLSYIVPAVNIDEIVKRQRAGEKTDLFTTKSHGSGPVQIDVELQGAPYMLSNFEAVLLFKIKNRGSGTLVKSQIDNGSMEIIFPPEFAVIPDKSSEKFTCYGDPRTGGTRCVNDAKQGNEDLGVIPLYRDESRSSLRFTVKLKDQLLEPFRSYQITSAVRYSYELRNSVDITVNPFQNV